MRLVPSRTSFCVAGSDFFGLSRETTRFLHSNGGAVGQSVHAIHLPLLISSSASHWTRAPIFSDPPDSRGWVGGGKEKRNWSMTRLHFSLCSELSASNFLKNLIWGLWTELTWLDTSPCCTSSWSALDEWWYHTAVRPLLCQWLYSYKLALTFELLQFLRTINNEECTLKGNKTRTFPPLKVDFQSFPVGRVSLLCSAPLVVDFFFLAFIFHVIISIKTLHWPPPQLTEQLDIGVSCQ